MKKSQSPVALLANVSNLTGSDAQKARKMANNCYVHIAGVNIKITGMQAKATIAEADSKLNVMVQDGDLYIAPKGTEKVAGLTPTHTPRKRKA